MRYEQYELVYYYYYYYVCTRIIRWININYLHNIRVWFDANKYIVFNLWRKIWNRVEYYTPKRFGCIKLYIGRNIPGRYIIYIHHYYKYGWPSVGNYVLCPSCLLPRARRQLINSKRLFNMLYIIPHIIPTGTVVKFIPVCCSYILQDNG